ncbi:hypothetical protein EU545_04260 [Candidatus Thorarchaeota archaeon]|nr:MAG: hypothetical protein EU545_04260 [Candidatus Thorarchaeota archaeon]
MKISQSLKCSELKKADVFDSDGKEVGNIDDLTFVFEAGELRLSQFILGGPVLEEFLEALKLRPDRDPVFDASMIEKIDEDVHLNTTLDKMKTTLDDCAISDEEIRLSKLTKMDIMDAHGKKVGNALDVHFDADGSVSIIVGEGFIEEKLEALGLKEDVDIIVPGDVIESLDKMMNLKVSKDALGTTMEEVLEQRKPEIIAAREARDVSRSVTKVTLFTQRPI